MADRSYLYTTDHLPESPEWKEKVNLRSISEWNYAIPLSFKLLLTGNPIAVRSSIWDTPEKIAIAGEFQAGVSALREYLSRLPSDAEALVKEANDFLSTNANERKYFILECGEIFEMEEDSSLNSIEARNFALLEEIKTLKNQITTIKVPHAAMPDKANVNPVGEVADSKKAVLPADPLQPFYDIGLGNWTNILYYQFENV